MLAYYRVDKTYRVFICCYYADYVVPSEDWKLAEIEDVPFSDGAVPLYKEVNGRIVPRSAEEIRADKDALPVQEPTEMEQIRADVDYLLMMVDEV